MDIVFSKKFFSPDKRYIFSCVDSLTGLVYIRFSRSKKQKYITPIAKKCFQFKEYSHKNILRQLGIFSQRQENAEHWKWLLFEKLHFQVAPSKKYLKSKRNPFSHSAKTITWSARISWFLEWKNYWFPMVFVECENTTL